MKRLLQLFISFSISAIAIWVIFSQKINLNDVIYSLQNAKLIFLIFSIFFLICSMWAISKRWALLLNSNNKINNTQLTSALWIGYFGNVILPFRLGEIIRGYIVSEKAEISFVYVITTIFIEKIFDIGILLFLLLIVNFTYPLPLWIQYITEFAALVFIILFFLVLLFILKKGYFFKLIFSIQSISNRYFNIPVEKWFQSFILALRSVNNPIIILKIIGWSLTIWSFGFLLNCCIIWSLGIEPWFFVSILSQIVLNLGMAIPSMPGYVGVYHFLAIATLTIFNINPSIALSYAILSHFIMFGSFTIGGIIALFLTEISITKLYKQVITIKSK